MLTRDDLARFAPRPARGGAANVWDQYVEALVEHGPALLAEHGIDEPLELQHFMAQVGHESGGFTVLWESGAYSPEGLLRIFGAGVHSAAVTPAEAARLCALRGEERDRAIFERVYGLGNPRKASELGNRDPGDGWRYRGFGVLQTTGRRDHERLIGGDYTALGALKAALAEWTRPGPDSLDCNDLARLDDVKRVTRRINGGYNGLDDRRARLAKAKRVWPAMPADGRAPVTSMMQSTTARTAEAVGAGGAVTTNIAAPDVAAVVAKAAQAEGGLTFGNIVWALVQSPMFWVMMIGLMSMAASAYIWLERKRKLDLHGI